MKNFEYKYKYKDLCKAKEIIKANGKIIKGKYLKY